MGPTLARAPAQQSGHAVTCNTSTVLPQRDNIGRWQSGRSDPLLKPNGNPTRPNRLAPSSGKGRASTLNYLPQLLFVSRTRRLLLPLPTAARIQNDDPSRLPRQAIPGRDRRRGKPPPPPGNRSRESCANGCMGVQDSVTGLLLAGIGVRISPSSPPVRSVSQPNAAPSTARHGTAGQSKELPGSRRQDG